jgi:hypothetical protein
MAATSKRGAWAHRTALGAAALCASALGVSTLCSGAALGAPGSSAPIVRGARLPLGATEGLSPARDGKSPVALPDALALAFRAHVSFGIVELFVADDGRLVCTTPNQELVELDQRGRRLGSVALPGLPLRAGILANGTRVVASDRGLVTGIDQNGSVRFEAEPGWTRLGESVELLPLPLGGFVVASLRRVVWFDDDGALRGAVALEEAVRSLSLLGRELVVTLGSGTVVRWNGYDAPSSLGDFGAPLESQPIVHEGKLLALTSSSAVLKDEVSGRTRSLATGLDVEAGTLPFSIGSDLGWLGTDNTLVRLDWNRTATKLPLGPETTTRAPGVRPLSDRRGSVALLNALGELTLVSASGVVVTDSETRCSEPVALLPQRAGRIVLGCRTGAIWAFGS